MFGDGGMAPGVVGAPVGGDALAAVEEFDGVGGSVWRSDGRGRTGFRVVKPRALAAAPPHGTMISPHSDESEASAFSTEGAQGPKRVSTGRM